MLREFVNKNGDFIIDIEGIYGTGWILEIERDTKNIIKPEKLRKNDIEVGWSYSEIEFEVEKNNIKFIIHLDDESGVYIKTANSLQDKDKHRLREWATIISMELSKRK
jgi:hypothetical protein